MPYLERYREGGGVARLTIAVGETVAAPCGSIRTEYTISGYDVNRNQSVQQEDPLAGLQKLTLLLQSGRVGIDGPNGITLESLLSICANELEKAKRLGFEGHAQALQSVENAIKAIRQRDRRLRGSHDLQLVANG